MRLERYVPQDATSQLRRDHDVGRRVRARFRRRTEPISAATRSARSACACASSWSLFMANARARSTRSEVSARVNVGSSRSSAEVSTPAASAAPSLARACPRQRSRCTLSGTRTAELGPQGRRAAVLRGRVERAQRLIVSTSDSEPLTVGGSEPGPEQTRCVPSNRCPCIGELLGSGPVLTEFGQDEHLLCDGMRQQVRSVRVARGLLGRLVVFPRSTDLVPVERLPTSERP